MGFVSVTTAIIARSRSTDPFSTLGPGAVYPGGVKQSSSIPVCLALTILVATPRLAHADAPEGPAPMTVVGARAAPGAIGPIGARLPLFGAEPAAGRPAWLAPTPAEIRLSRGARTAIIVTAIVVGVLVIAGVVAVARPGHL